VFDLIFSYAYRFLKKYLGVHRHLPEKAQTLIWMIALYDFNFALSSVFINIFLYKKAGDLMTPGLFNLASYPAIMLGFWVGGHISKKWGHLLPYQLGFVFNALVFLAVLILQEKAPSYPVTLGILSGLGIGFYYLGQHSLTLDLTETKARDYFLSLSMFLSSILRILAPALAGWVIQSFHPEQMAGGLLQSHSSNGYYLVFTLTLAIYLGLIVKSFQIDVKPTGKGFHFWRVLTFDQNRDWNRLLWTQFLLGLRNGVFWFIVGILVYRVSKNEAVVGSYNMLANFLAVLTAYGLSRWAEEKNRRWGIWVSALLCWAACGFLFWRIDYFSLLAYAVLNAVGVTWFQVGFGALSFEAVEKAREAGERKLEYLAIREMPLGIGRVIGLGAFLLGLSHFGELGLRVSLLAFGFCHMGVFFFLPKAQKS
jgi:MFS transporter, YQGE family, putative transporter